MNKPGQDFEDIRFTPNARVILSRNSPTHPGQRECLLLSQDSDPFDFPLTRLRHIDSSQQAPHSPTLTPGIDKDAMAADLEDIIGIQLHGADLSFLGRDNGEAPSDVSAAVAGTNYYLVDIGNQTLSSPLTKENSRGNQQWMPIEDITDNNVREFIEDALFSPEVDIRSIGDGVRKRIAVAVRKPVTQAAEEVITKTSDANDLSINDIFEPQKLRLSQRRAIFESDFGSLEEPDSFDFFIECLKVAFDYHEQHRGTHFPREVAAKFSILDTPDTENSVVEAFAQDFLRGFGFNNEENIGFLREIYLAARAHAKVLKAKPNFTEEISEIDKAFNAKFDSIFKTKSRSGKTNYSIGDIKLSDSSSCPNAKTVYRIIDKLITKPNAQFEDIQDILRFQVVLLHSDNFKAVRRAIMREYEGCNLKEKKEKPGTRGAGVSENVTWLIGEYAGYPVEIRIVKNEAGYNAMNSEDRVHDLFAMIKTNGIRETKMGRGIKDKELSNEFDRLAKIPRVQNILNTTRSNKSIGKQASKGGFENPRFVEPTKAKLVERWKTFYFPAEDVWIPYSEVLRLWKSSLNPHFRLQLKHMCTHLNIRVQKPLSEDQWINFFENPQTVLSAISIVDKKFHDRLKTLAEKIPGFDIQKGVTIHS